MTANTVPQNRARRAREQAGLSVGQAARLLGVTVAELTAAESAGPYHNCSAERLADLYGVDVDWLIGVTELRDYAALNHLPGGRELPFCDRDVLAEFLASRPRRPA